MLREVKLTDTGWLPIVLCPTDGVDRLLLLASGREVIGSVQKGVWQVIGKSIQFPGRKLEPIGGVERTSAPYLSHLMERLTTDLPTHFRPNDTVHGRPNVKVEANDQKDGAS